MEREMKENRVPEAGEPAARPEAGGSSRNGQMAAKTESAKPVAAEVSASEKSKPAAEAKSEA